MLRAICLLAFNDGRSGVSGNDTKWLWAGKERNDRKGK